MATRFSKLTLRDLFWLMLLAAIGVGWYLERTRAMKQIAEYKLRWPFGRMPIPQLSAEAVQRQQLLTQYRALSNAQVDRLFSSIPPAGPFHASPEYQCCLTEMARRRMHAELQIHYDNFMRVGDKQYGGPANALLLTALRRAQGKPDPVEVQAKLDVQTTIVNEHPELTPAILVNLKNVDSEAICLTNGGDYRSGRQTRWRVQLTNEQGVRIADSNFPLFGIGGGMSSFGPLKPDDLLYQANRFEGNRLDARSYVKSPPTGRYQLQVVYAEQEIAGEPALTGLIVWQSTPLAVLIENQTAQHEQRFSAIPLLGILLCGAVVFVAAVISRHRNPPAVNETPRRWSPPWRDLVAFFILAALAIGWLIDARQLTLEIERLRPDQQAEWSIQAVED